MKFATTTALFSLAFFLASTVEVAEAFSTPTPPEASLPTPPSPLAIEAAEIYSQKYPFDADASNPNPFGDMGVPTTDIDGTPLKSIKKDPSKRKSFAGISEQQAYDNFAVISSIYGEDRAIQMVKIEPLSLAFSSSAMAETFDIWAEKFGAEETKEMVLRNPGLLSVKPAYAKTSDGSTMVFSYIIAATRPIGLLGPFLIVALLAVPFLESVTGIPIKEAREAALPF